MGTALKTIQETGAWKNVGGRPFPHLGLSKQIQTLMKELGHLRRHPHKTLAPRSIQTREDNLRAFVETLKRLGRPLKSLLDIEQRHITAAIGEWKASDLMLGTLHNRVANLRWLTNVLDKPGLVGDLEYYGIDALGSDLASDDNEDKSWSGNHVAPLDLIMKATEIDSVVGMQLALIHQFGLSVMETILIVPSQADRAVYLAVEDGAPQGRMRMVAIRTIEQREVLDKAKHLASKIYAHGRLTKPRATPTQSKHHLYYVLGRKLGITKALSGVTLDGLRRDFEINVRKLEEKAANSESLSERHFA